MKHMLRGCVIPVAMAAISTVGAQFALAATDQANTEIMLKFNESIDINGLENLTFEDPAPSTDAEGWVDFCIRGIGFTNFEIQFDSLNGDGAYILSNGSTDIPYQVSFRNVSGGSFSPTNEGVALNGQILQNPGNCNGAPDNSTFEVLIPNANWENPNVLSGTIYTDVLTVTVTSE
ncbi:hypothetical protein [Microbulbifer sp. JMSA008]|jgi:hypothetical protein|uniref:hypothetical protein n=1 Tax=Microbulbifer sp. JMSA008 TaxID=3243373 RepID=UPI0040393645